MSAHNVTYDRARFPKRQKRADGTWGCRGCGGEIPKGRKTWCSHKCVKTYEPASVLIAVRARDKDVCQLCGFDCAKAKREWRKLLFELGLQEHWYWRKEMPPRPPNPEYDHITPFSEGGLTILENMRTLCAPCHRKVTREWRAKRVKRRGSK